jgi:hypothetical protein
VAGARVVRSAIAATGSIYIVNNGVGLAIAVADDLGASPLGISTGLDPEVDFFFRGTALCAPFMLLVVLAVLVALIFGDRAELALRGLIVCGIFSAAGMLAEPITYRVLSPGGSSGPTPWWWSQTSSALDDERVGEKALQGT